MKIDKYKLALEITRKYYNHAKEVGDYLAIARYENIFPELRESEDKEKTIEIPFGAKDSELCDFEYTIPEGMEAKIKDGKVIIKKKESEDEKATDIIFDCIFHCFDADFISREQRNKVLAWLEKQKENPDRLTIVEKAKSEKQVVLLTESKGDENIYWDTKSEEDAVSLLEKGLKFFGKQKKQKPVKCIEFDNEFENQVSHLLASVLNGEYEYNKGFIKYAAQSLLGYAMKEQKPEIKVIIPKFRVGDIIKRVPLEKWDSTKRVESIDEHGYTFNFKHLNKSGGGYIGFAFEKEYELDEQKPIKVIYIPKFRSGDTIVSTKNPHLTYIIRKTGIMDESGELCYECEILADGKSDNDIKLLSIEKVDSWGELVKQKPVEYGDEFITEAEEYASKVNCGDYKVEVTEAYIAGALRSYNKPAEKQDYSGRDEESEEALLGLIGFIENWKEKAKDFTKQVALWSSDESKCDGFLSFLKSLSSQQKPIPKFKVGDCIYDKRDSYNRNVIREVGKDYYINAFAQKMDMAYTDTNFEFLERLDDDILPNQPAEWSEEDNVQLNAAIQIVNNSGHSTTANWLKSLRPQPHWKPSDEQMEELEKVLHRCPETLDTDKAKVLWGLFEQLKKLM